LKVAAVKPLKLRIEKAYIAPKLLEAEPYIEVLIKSPFLQSQEIYTYHLIAGAESAAIGDLVFAPFGSHTVEGVIVARSSESQTAGGIKAIISLISASPVFTVGQIELALALGRRYATDTWSFLSSMAPPFSKVGERRYLSNRQQQLQHRHDLRMTQTLSDVGSKPAALSPALTRRLQSNELLRELFILSTGSDSYGLIISVALERAARGKTVVVLPDVKDLIACQDILDRLKINYSSITSQLSKSDRFEAYLVANSMTAGIVLTLRHGVLLALHQNDTLLIVNEVESHHYERRSPSFNSRDVALLRSSERSIIFISHSPSVEIVRQVEVGWLTKYEFGSSKVRGMKFLTPQGDEPAIFPMIERSLQKGNVLISVARAGYINGFSCKKCRTRATCPCGGHLAIFRTESSPSCAICGEVAIDWHCPQCNSPEMWVTSRGAIRKAAEFGRAFPKHRVIASSGRDQIVQIPLGTSLVIATIGSEPVAQYQGIFILDAEAAYSHVDLRSQEEMRSHWFKLLSSLAPEGDFYLSLPAHEVLSQGMIRSQAYDLALRESNERFLAQLPPFYRTIICEGNFADLAGLSALLQARAFISYPMVNSAKGIDRLLVKVETARGEEFSELLAGVQRIRAAQKSPLFALRFDPFSIV